MTTTEAAVLWTEGAKDALDTAQKLYKSGKYHHALFFCHLAVEKALKSRYIADHSELPPYTHDLVLLAAKLKFTFTADQQKEFAEINTFNISARYQEEKMDLYQRATSSYASDWLKRSELMMQTIIPHDLKS